MSDAPQGRSAQRRRTRKAIVEATGELLARGRTPTVDEVAEAADVSRRTVYLHFSTLDQLLIDATAGALSHEVVDTALDWEAYGDDVAARIEVLAGTMLDLAPVALPLGRQLIRLTVDVPDREETPVGTPRRGYRRIEWIERAVEPLRDRLTAEQFERLVSGLATVIGWEAMIVLQDLRGLDADRERTATIWSARSLVESMLAEADLTPGGPGPV